MTRRLYLRIYLAVLASLAVFALIAGIAWRIGAETWEPRREQIALLAGELVAELLPAAPAGADELKGVLDHWHERARVDLSLYAPGGALLASAGRPIERDGRRRAAGAAGAVPVTAARRRSSRNFPTGANCSCGAVGRQASGSAAGCRAFCSCCWRPRLRWASARIRSCAG